MIRQHFQKFLLSSLTLRRVIFAVNGLLGAPFANFVQKRASYSTFTYVPKSMLLCSWGTQREYSSKPLKHSIVKRVLVFKRWIWAYFYPL